MSHTWKQKMPNGKTLEFHFHVCRCGKRWKHSSKMQGNDAAHKCPRCGEHQFSRERLKKDA